MSQVSSISLHSKTYLCFQVINTQMQFASTTWVWEAQCWLIACMGACMDPWHSAYIIIVPWLHVPIQVVIHSYLVWKLSWYSFSGRNFKCCKKNTVTHWYLVWKSSRKILCFDGPRVLNGCIYGYMAFMNHDIAINWNLAGERYTLELFHIMMSRSPLMMVISYWRYPSKLHFQWDCWLLNDFGAPQPCWPNLNYFWQCRQVQCYIEHGGVI